MAEIKVQKKSGWPWWAWVILALVAVALIWWAMSAMGDEEEATVATTPPAVATAPGAVGDETAGAVDRAPITDLAVLMDAQDPAALVGREVRLQGVSVQEMVGDASFWVGEDQDRRVFVILDEQIPSPPPEVEGRVNVNQGQTVDVQGSVRAGDDLPGGVLDDEGRNALGDRRIYVWAQAAQVATRP
ncbi:hypothetical protein [Phenylobacterium sp.]|uniref:hypothetical protein n=1 Tax=Phenylobacterium sp. TaxID=1871053 RepID=UPI0035C82DCE